MSPSDQIVPLVVALIVLCFIIIAAGFGMLFFAYKFAERNEEYYSSTEEADYHSTETVKVETPQPVRNAIWMKQPTFHEIPAFRWLPMEPTLPRVKKIAHTNLEKTS